MTVGGGGGQTIMASGPATGPQDLVSIAAPTTLGSYTAYAPGGTGDISRFTAISAGWDKNETAADGDAAELYLVDVPTPAGIGVPPNAQFIGDIKGGTNRSTIDVPAGRMAMGLVVRRVGPVAGAPAVRSVLVTGNTDPTNSGSSIVQTAPTLTQTATAGDATRLAPAGNITDTASGNASRTATTGNITDTAGGTHTLNAAGGVGIGAVPNASAVLDVQSTTKYARPAPSYTEAGEEALARSLLTNAAPAGGAIFSTADKTLKVWNGAAFVPLSTTLLTLVVRRHPVRHRQPHHAASAAVRKPSECDAPAAGGAERKRVAHDHDLRVRRQHRERHGYERHGGGGADRELRPLREHRRRRDVVAGAERRDAPAASERCNADLGTGHLSRPPPTPREPSSTCVRRRWRRSKHRSPRRCLRCNKAMVQATLAGVHQALASLLKSSVPTRMGAKSAR